MFEVGTKHSMEGIVYMYKVQNGFTGWCARPDGWRASWVSSRCW